MAFFAAPAGYIDDGGGRQTEKMGLFSYPFNPRMEGAAALLFSRWNILVSRSYDILILIVKFIKIPVEIALGGEIEGGMGSESAV